MKYNFNTPVDRSVNFSAKYDECASKFGKDGLIPLWIADMDLKTAPEIIDAIDKRNKQGIYGYTTRPDTYWDALCDWHKKRNDWEIDKNLISFNTGVVPAICSLISELTQKGDYILFTPPVYGEFFDFAKNWGREALVVDLCEENGYYTLDLNAFEEALKKGPKFFILCNPHNPVGRVWTKEELKAMGDLCVKYNVLIISDEIHSDLILYGNKHMPMAVVSKEIANNTITCTSVSKTFNLAGVQASATIFPNSKLKAIHDNYWQKIGIHRNNCFSLVAVEAALREGEEWLTQLLKHIESNIDYVDTYLKENIPQITFRKPEGTYLIWLNCKNLNMSADELKIFMIEKAGLALSDGRGFGSNGEGYVRINVACSIDVLEKALTQLKKAVDNHLK